MTNYKSVDRTIVEAAKNEFLEISKLLLKHYKIFQTGLQTALPAQFIYEKHLNGITNAKNPATPKKPTNTTVLSHFAVAMNLTNMLFRHFGRCYTAVHLRPQTSTSATNATSATSAMLQHTESSNGMRGREKVPQSCAD